MLPFLCCVVSCRVAVSLRYMRMDGPALLQTLSESVAVRMRVGGFGEFTQATLILDFWSRVSLLIHPHGPALTKQASLLAVAPSILKSRSRVNWLVCRRRLDQS